MIADSSWTDRRHRTPSTHQPRPRRECLGELLRIDFWEHACFAGRGETCAPLAFVDTPIDSEPPPPGARPGAAVPNVSHFLQRHVVIELPVANIPVAVGHALGRAEAELVSAGHWREAQRCGYPGVGNALPGSAARIAA